MFAVSSVLLLVFMSGRFVKYLAQAAAGKLAPDVLLAIMAYRLPGFLELVIPLGLFLAILLAYGRLYMDSEMTVLSACGMSNRRLIVYTLIPATFVALLVAWLSLVVSPIGIQKAEAVLESQRQRNEFDSLTPARFQSTQGGRGVTYTEALSDDRQLLKQVFMAEMANTSEQSDLAVVVAKEGEQVLDKTSDHLFLELRDGHRYEGQPGNANYRVTEFVTYRQRLTENKAPYRRPAKADTLSTAALLSSDKLEDRAALQWRLSVPMLVFVVALLAVPLSRTNPRSGRYLKMIPAILLYIIYLVSLNAGRAGLEDGKLPIEFGLWWIHLIFLSIAIVLIVFSDGFRTRKLKAPQPETAAGASNG
jgi:lipopolysaccharide export system permease protein